MTGKTILLFGPKFAKGSGVYGGGVGGYTRNFAAYLNSLMLSDYQFSPVFHSVRGDGGFLRRNPVSRLISDTYAVLHACLVIRPWAVHVLAQYRRALPREVLAALICRLLKIRFVYDIKAGSFEKAYNNGSRLYRYGIRFILKTAASVLVEGRSVEKFLADEFEISSYFFPNFVPISEIPPENAKLFVTNDIRVLFVGYCYADKGVVQLVEGCRQAAQHGVNIVLNLVGEEHAEFSRWIDTQQFGTGITIVRHGRVPHETVLAHMSATDVYAYPTSHPGEGHNNSINEAMMHGLVILVTRHGFLPDVLSDRCAFFLDSASENDIASNLIAISRDKEGAAKTGMRARQRLINEYTSVIASKRLTKVYERI